jgi:hypothetical protein
MRSSMFRSRESGYIKVNLHARQPEIVAPGRLHLECVRVRDYIARHELDSGHGRFAEISRV